MHYTKTKEELFKEFETSDKGLTSKKSVEVLKTHGYNVIKEKKKILPLEIFLNQFKSVLVGILIAAMVISGLIGEIVDSIFIFVIIILNAIMGFIQEYKAEKSIEALKKLTSLKAKVIRDGKEIKIDAKNIVPGDILVLEEGDKIPADARLIEVNNFETQEASLTGESTTVRKNLNLLAKNIEVADQRNMVFSGTIAAKGNARAIVVGTGMSSEIGKIAIMIHEGGEKLTPLQVKLKHLGKWIGIATIVIVTIVFLAGVFNGKEIPEMFILAISLAVAAIPEGLPAVVTISLALGVQRMIKRNSLIRKLPSVETLGSTDVICSDKTGTITRNEMTVRRLYVDKEIINITGEGYSMNGKFSKKTHGMDMLMKIGALCNNSSINEGEVIGDPTEAALLVSAGKLGLNKQTLQKENKRVNEIPFDSERKRMTTIHETRSGRIALTKGAVDVVIELCDFILENGRVRKITEQDKKRVIETNNRFAKDALRVLGFAYRNVLREFKEEKLVFVGMQGMIDPPRDGVKEAIAKCKKAGIKVVMITGDYQLTAEAVAKEIGLTGKSITGKELNNIEDLRTIVEDTNIYARVNPSHKVMIVKALEENGHVVAVSGDGVNDAPALKAGEIGVAMGITGTDVAKEASDMILTDDNFASIVNAVEEGRNIYNNIKKFVQYLLSSNMGEILTIFLAILIGFTLGGEAILPLIAIQILWMNLVTDGLPALALSVDTPDPDVMTRPPRKKTERILNIKRTTMMFLFSIIMAVGTLLMFKLKLVEADYSRTIAFTTLVMFQMFNVMNFRSEESSLFRIGIFSNKYLIAAILSSILLQILIIYTPLNTIFHTVPILFIDWIFIISVSASVLVIGELVKFGIRSIRGYAHD
ncbi:calcium-translocating P-type ATPase, SERCA-type [Candidatus Woesearchaeota archaeon]|nr:calcium-translocating P-type ATPase, SERCA-type [Candidatus Woesearchaeota archaeon]